MILYVINRQINKLNNMNSLIPIYWAAYMPIKTSDNSTIRGSILHFRTEVIIKLVVLYFYFVVYQQKLMTWLSHLVLYNIQEYYYWTHSFYSHNQFCQIMSHHQPHTNIRFFIATPVQPVFKLSSFHSFYSFVCVTNFLNRHHIQLSSSNSFSDFGTSSNHRSNVDCSKSKLNETFGLSLLQAP